MPIVFLQEIWKGEGCRLLLSWSQTISPFQVWMYELSSAWELTRIEEVSGATQQPTSWRKESHPVAPFSRLSTPQSPSLAAESTA